MNIQELLNLAGEQGKVVIVDDKGELKAVLLSGAEYKHLAQLPSNAEIAESEAEAINREILLAQLEEVMGLPAAAQPMPDPAERIDSLLARRAEDLFRSVPADKPLPHPYSNFTAPEVATEADEEIKPNFDDI
jgi:PHD/YefM family antitoxin component YafN of YafNO toxin-antitoxin module